MIKFMIVALATFVIVTTLAILKEAKDEGDEK